MRPRAASLATLAYTDNSLIREVEGAVMVPLPHQPPHRVGVHGAFGQQVQHGQRHGRARQRSRALTTHSWSPGTDYWPWRAATEGAGSGAAAAGGYGADGVAVTRRATATTVPRMVASSASSGT